MRWLLVSVMMLFSLHSFAERIEMNNVPVSEFTDWYSKKTGKGVIVPDNFIEKITVFNSDIQPDEIHGFFVSVMASRGYDVNPGNPIVISKSKKGAHVVTNEEDNTDEVNQYWDEQGSSLQYLPDYPSPELGKFFDQKTETYRLNNVLAKITGQGVDVKNPFQTIERRDVGISLDVTPVVMNNSTVMLTVKSKADSISPVANATDIVFNQRSIDTTVQLKDGDTLLIGGLIQHNVINAETSTPYASDIPLIGWLFDSKSDSDDKAVMYILIRARILRAA